MRNVVNENLFEDIEDDNGPDRHFDVNLEDEINYFTDLEDGLKDDPDTYQQFKDAIEEFGLDSEETAIISSYGADADWEDIKEELDRRQIEYYEFDTDDGESAILFNINDIKNKE